MRSASRRVAVIAPSRTFALVKPRRRPSHAGQGAGRPDGRLPRDACVGRQARGRARRGCPDGRAQSAEYRGLGAGRGPPRTMGRGGAGPPDARRVLRRARHADMFSEEGFGDVVALAIAGTPPKYLLVAIPDAAVAAIGPPEVVKTRLDAYADHVDEVVVLVCCTDDDRSARPPCATWDRRLRREVVQVEAGRGPGRDEVGEGDDVVLVVAGLRVERAPQMINRSPAWSMSPYTTHRGLPDRPRGLAPSPATSGSCFFAGYSRWALPASDHLCTAGKLDGGPGRGPAQGEDGR